MSCGNDEDVTHVCFHSVCGNLFHGSQNMIMQLMRRGHNFGVDCLSCSDLARIRSTSGVMTIMKRETLLEMG